jgi:predicted methyltransferase
MSIDKAYRKVQQRLKIEKAQKSAIDNNKTTTNSSYDLKYGDMREKSKEIQDNSIDLIFTDPPYNEEGISLYGELARIAQRVLKPGGSLVTFIGHYALFKIGKQIEDNSVFGLHLKGPGDVLSVHAIETEFRRGL